MAPSLREASETLQEALQECVVGVNKTMSRLLPETDDAESRLYQAMRHGVLSGGKRLRAFMVMQSARMFNVDSARARRVAAALEFVHCYSLIHDDLPAMDNSDLRRGVPTVHVRYDEATAILAGDALLTLAFEILSDPETHPDPHVRIELVRKLRPAGHGRRTDARPDRRGTGIRSWNHLPHATHEDGQTDGLCLRSRRDPRQSRRSA
jgi:farnesyl diphosphate synthase